jgi:WD40 repeat protein
VIESDPCQFAPQVVGRLLPHRDVPAIARWVNEIAAAAPRPWLRPLRPALQPPGTGLLRTLEGHSSVVNVVAVTADGRRAVSGSGDKTLKVWDLESGRAQRTLEGHSSGVISVAVTADGRRAVSASWDKTLKVWDLQSGRALRTLEGHSSGVRGVAVTADGRRAVSASEDKTLKVWDLESGLPLVGLRCDASLRCCTFADGRKIIAGDYGGRLHFLLFEERTRIDQNDAML